MRVINQSRQDMDKKLVYKLTKSKKNVSVKDLEDSTEITPTDWLIYEDVNKNGEEVEILSILCENGEVVTAQSPTFKESFLDMVEAFGNDFTCQKISGRSKNGREYVDCELCE